MFNFKKTASALICSALVMTAAAGCGSSETKKDGKISVVCTIFPEYDWAREIMGDKADDAEITYLLDSGVDLHSYQPTAEDILKISSCDVFIYVGGESDEWVEDALSEATNKKMKVINLMNVLGDDAKEEELKEGMQGEEEEEEEGEEEEKEYDEHIWLSLKNAKVLCGEIEKNLAAVDPDNADTYKKNLDAYTAKLDKLDGDLTSLTSQAKQKTLIFGDRFPFRYFVDDYGLDYYAAFIGCSAESEASFETIVFLAKKLDELGLKSIMQIESSDGSIAGAIKDASQTKDQTVLTLDSMQSTLSKDIDGGVTYLSIMESNLQVLKEALK